MLFRSAKTSSRLKLLGFQHISRNPLPHDLLANSFAPSGRGRTEIPPEVIAGEPGSAPPTAGPAPEFQPTTADSHRPGPVGVALAGLGWLENPALPGSTQHRHPMASSRVSALLAMEKPSAKNRSENHRPCHHHFDSGNESRHSIMGCSQNSRRVAQARHQSGATNRRQLYGPTHPASLSSQPESFPAQSL